MSMRVATFANSSRMLEASMRIQARMSEMQLQEASGIVSTTYGGLGSDSGKLVDLQVSFARSRASSEAISEAGSRIEVMYTTLGTITDLITEFRTEIAAAKSTDSDAESTASLQTAAQSYLEELAATLNTKYEGRYMFAGSLTETAPVDIDGYVADAATASTDYYAGNGTMTSVRVSSELSVTYGISASDSAFEQIFRSLGIVAQSSGTLDSDTLDTAYDLLDSALNDTITLQSSLSVKASSLDRFAEWHADYQDLYSASISQIKEVDVAELTVKLTAYETQLQASYAALAKIMSLSLQDYL
jgi:flagellar hook-associated protein 3 FlgL